MQIDINAALPDRDLVPAIAVFTRMHGRGARVIAPERLMVTPNARLIIVEHVLGAAIEQLQFGRDRLWQEFRVAMPPSAGLPRFDHRADVTGMGLVALALILGRPLGADEYPHRIPDLLNDARERSALGDEQPLSQPLRAWLARALQIDVRRSFASAPEAMAALDEVVSDEGMYVAAPVALETFLSRISRRCWNRRAPARRCRARPGSRRRAAPHIEPPRPLFQTADVEIEARFDEVVSHHTSHGGPTPESSAGAIHTRTRDITELLGSDPLPGSDPIAAAPARPLFNPDAPFTAAASTAVYAETSAARPRGRILAIVAIVLVLCGGGGACVQLYGTTS